MEDDYTDFLDFDKRQPLFSHHLISTYVPPLIIDTSNQENEKHLYIQVTVPHLPPVAIQNTVSAEGEVQLLP